MKPESQTAEQLTREDFDISQRFIVKGSSPNEGDLVDHQCPLRAHLKIILSPMDCWGSYNCPNDFTTVGWKTLIEVIGIFRQVRPLP